MKERIVSKGFTQLKKNLKKDTDGFLSIKLAVLGDSSTQFLVQALRGVAYEYKINLNIWEAEFNQIEQQVFDPQSELYKFSPDYVLLYKSSQKLLEKFNKSNAENRIRLAENEINNLSELYSTLTDKLSAKIIFYNYVELNDSVYGNFGLQTEQSFSYQLRSLNYKLMQYASSADDLYLCDLSNIQNQLGRDKTFNAGIFINSELVDTFDSLPLMANRVIDIINSLRGRIYKCLILDLDNTLWGGIIGDDGYENIQLGKLGIGKAYTDLQYWAKKLKERGIILAICSKNNEEVAKEPFEKHPEMVLKLDDIAVFVANWDNKADNIRHIQGILNIGFDSMVFLDDNPFERNIVRENIPEICVPELPEDPALYLEYLYSLNLFETVSISKEDKDRTALYQTESKRVSVKKKFTNEGDYLKSLDMVSKVEGLNLFNIPRIAQLSQRSNQFNLRTIRYTENDLIKLNESNNHFVFAFSLQDKFGVNGLIAVIILKKQSDNSLFIESWFMSCRVLKRDMEEFTLNTLVEFANKNGFKEIIGEYIPTNKNELVKDHYSNLGFTSKEGKWYLNTALYKDKPCHISRS